MTEELDLATLDALAERLVDPIAKRVVQIIQEEGVLSITGPSNAWLNATDVAQLLGVTREWVYEHAEELGAVRIGNGQRPRLRFSQQRLALRQETEHLTQRHRLEPRKNRPNGLIPIHDDL